MESKQADQTLHSKEAAEIGREATPLLADSVASCREEADRLITRTVQVFGLAEPADHRSASSSE